MNDFQISSTRNRNEFILPPVTFFVYTNFFSSCLFLYLPLKVACSYKPIHFIYLCFCSGSDSDTKRQLLLRSVYKKNINLDHSPIRKLTPSVRSLSYNVTNFLPSTTNGVISNNSPSVMSQCSCPGRVT